MTQTWPTCGSNFDISQEKVLIDSQGSSVKIRTILDRQKQKSLNMALIWPKHGPNMVTILYDHKVQFVGPVWLFSENLDQIKQGLFMAKTRASHGPFNQFFLNLHECVQGSFLPNVRVLESILKDIFIFLTDSGTQGHDIDIELCTWPEARGQAN